jgi:hypothetical protein
MGIGIRDPTRSESRSLGLPAAGGLGKTVVCDAEASYWTSRTCMDWSITMAG